jgi:catechol 2,3-dioxygenase
MTKPLSPNHVDRSLLQSASVGEAGLIVADLRRSLDFYAGVIGLHVLSETTTSAQLGVAVDQKVLLELEQKPGVHSLKGKRLGLYHTAILLPSRTELASFAEHLYHSGIRAGSSNHIVSEAFYLTDPDGLEIEVYADRDRSEWPWRGSELDAAVLPLDWRDLLETPHSPWKGVPSGTTMGHIHLYVGDLEKADRLYRAGLGMNLRTRSIPGALFLAAGDYHHHVGLNTWAGQVPPAMDSDARLQWWSLKVPERERSSLQERMLQFGWLLGPGDSFADPWGIEMRFAL